MVSNQDIMSKPIQRVTILGTGLVGASIGLALRAHRFPGSIIGWDRERTQAGIALSRGALDEISEDPLTAAAGSDLILLAGPVFSIMEWLDLLAPVLRADQLVTDVGSVKGAICSHASRNYNGPGQPSFLPGHPMAGKESHGAANADAALFEGAVWLFTPPPGAGEQPHPSQTKWRGWVTAFGSNILDLDPARHDELCAWVSHLPQMLSTALSALLEDRFSGDEQMRAIGGRALREMTRLGASPYSMWRDIAHTNVGTIEPALLALEQTLTRLRENLRTPGLRELFDQANQFRSSLTPESAPSAPGAAAIVASEPQPGRPVAPGRSHSSERP
ncbi:MAG TPA: prephenate dehydrogenase/arogenate dehydrogenase family protein [Acidisarcina sp.]